MWGGGKVGNFEPYNGLPLHSVKDKITTMEKNYLSKSKIITTFLDFVENGPPYISESTTPRNFLEG